MNTSVVYFLGFLLVTAGLAYAAITLGVPGIWVAIGAIILVGIGLMMTVTQANKASAPSGTKNSRRSIDDDDDRDYPRRRTIDSDRTTIRRD